MSMTDLILRRKRPFIFSEKQFQSFSIRNGNQWCIIIFVAEMLKNSCFVIYKCSLCEKVNMCLYLTHACLRGGGGVE